MKSLPCEGLHAINSTRMMNTFTEIRQSAAVSKSLEGTHVWGIRLSLAQDLPVIDLTPVLKVLHSLWCGKSRSEILQHHDHLPYVEFMQTPGINAKKQLPSVANLIIRALSKEDIHFPRIHPAVDIVNLAAIQSGVSLGIFDAGCVQGELQLAFSAGGEQFLPIGGTQMIDIEPGRLVLRDSEKTLSLFSIRDSQVQAITDQTRSLWLLGCQVPGVTQQKVEQGMRLAIAQLYQYQVITTNGAMA